MGFSIQESAGLFCTLLSSEKLAGQAKREPALKVFSWYLKEYMSHYGLNFSGSVMRLFIQY